MSEEHAFQLHMTEYNALKTEILAQQRVRQQTFQLGVAGIIAIWAFVLRGTWDFLQDGPFQTAGMILIIAAWWLPVFIAAAGLVMNYTASKGVKQAGAYLAMIEEKYADDDLKGWHNTLIFMREPARKIKLKEKGEKIDSWPDRALPSDPILARLHSAIKEREIKQGYSQMLRHLWGSILAVTTGVAILASILIYTTAIT